MSNNIEQEYPYPQSFDEKFKAISEKNKTETNTQLAGRNAAQQVARTTEAVLGWPGNIKKGVQSSVKQITDFLGVPSPTQIEKNVFGEPIRNSIVNPPTSKEIREQATPIAAEVFSGDKNYLEPRNEAEKFAGELNQDITSFFMPGTSQLNMMTRIGAPIVANLAKQGVKFFGGSEEAQEKTKMGVMLATTLAGQSNPGQFASNRIAEAKNMIPPTMTVHVGNLANRLMPLYRRMTRGLGVPSKSRATQGMRDLADQVQNNRMSMHSLLDARDNINEWIAEAGGWDIPVATRAQTVRNLNELKSAIIQTIEENLNQRYPQAAELYRTGYEAAAVTHQSNAITNFIEKNFGRAAASVGAKLLFPGAVGGAALLPKAAIGIGAIAPIYKAGQVLYRVSRSPTLARYYQDVIRYSLQGNATAMSASMKKLDKELKKQEDKENKNKKMTKEEFKQSLMKKG